MLRRRVGHEALGADAVKGDFQQRVAIKLLRAHVGASVARRFGLERETLARLNHPHIGKLYDAGTLAEGDEAAVLDILGVWLDDLIA